VLIALLREELGFTGLIVTDGIEMNAVADRFGLAGASVRAIAAGADAICVGGGHADEATVELLRTALVDAVGSGDLPEQRLADAARRVGALAAWTAAQPTQVALAGEPSGMIAARRAVRVVSRPDSVGLLPLSGPAHVVELATTMHLAIDRHTPWGLADPLMALVPGTTSARLYPDDLADRVRLSKASLDPAAGRPLILVVRDAHRHPWMSEILEHVLAARPDTIVVELGVPGPDPIGATYIATHGAARACTQAAAELLTGRERGPR
jgi:beta-N-acetylhexosaminidase